MALQVLSLILAVLVPNIRFSSLFAVAFFVGSVGGDGVVVSNSERRVENSDSSSAYSGGDVGVDWSRILDIEVVVLWVLSTSLITD